MRKFIFLLALPLTIISCKKDEDQTSTCSINKNTVAGRYIITATKYKASSSDAEQDWFSGMTQCKKDDTYQLNNDGTVVVGDGTDVCPGPPPPGTITAWSISADGKVFTLDDIYDVSSFDCTNLVVTKKDFLVPGDIKTVTYTKN